MIARTILRWLWVMLGFLISSLIAVIVLFALGIFWLGDEIREAAPGDVFIRQTADFFAAVFFTTAVGPALTALPGLLAVIAGELLRIRSALYYTLGGGAALAVIPLLVRSEQATSTPAPGYMTIFAAAGFIGGFSYWALAGARA